MALIFTSIQLSQDGSNIRWYWQVLKEYGGQCLRQLIETDRIYGWVVCFAYYLRFLFRHSVFVDFWIVCQASVYFSLKQLSVKLIQLVKRTSRSRKFEIRWWICLWYRSVSEADHWNITGFVVIVSTDN